MNIMQATSIQLLTFGLLLAQTTPAGSDAGQITITPPESQKVITGAPERFTGSVRVQSFFDASAQRDPVAGR